MHFSTITISASVIVGALAGYGYEAPHHTKEAKPVYTTSSICTDSPDYKPTKPVYKAPVYKTTTPVYQAPVYTTKAPVYNAPVYNVHTYTSYELVTVTSCGEYVKDCPAKVYTSTVYSVSTCTEGYTAPTDSAPYYVPPSNNTDYAAPVYEAPTTPVYEAPYAAPTLTHTYYTTVCPGANYCYGTTITSTYCPYSTSAPAAVYTPPAYTAPVHTEAPYVPPPTYTQVPTKNETTYVPPPQYTGGAASTSLNIAVMGMAGLLAIFIAA
jgi:hypothetical protein